jgi:prepilin-type N-terminal cleavage/methylation domain-containing protein
MSNTANKRARPGFTLIELLVVIAILTILVALSAGAYLRFLTDQGGRTTRSTLSTVKRLLDARWQAVVDKAYKDPIPVVEQWKVQNLAGSDRARQRVVWMKLRLKQEFPQSFAEIMIPPALNPTELGVKPAHLLPLPDYVNYLKKNGITQAMVASTPTQPFESAVCLLMILEKGGLTQDELNPFVQTFTYNGKPLRGLADGWGQPLAFCRFPTKCPILNPGGNPQSGYRDVGDPEGLLADDLWAQSSSNPSSPTEFDLFRGMRNPPGTGPFVVPMTVHDLPLGSAGQSYAIKPVVASSGPDKQLGLDILDLGNPTAQADDNLYSIDAK